MPGDELVTIRCVSTSVPTGEPIVDSGVDDPSAASPVPTGEPTPTWWTLDGVHDGRVLAGPFPTKLDAQMATPPAGTSWGDLDVTVVYGIRSADGRVHPRQSPADGVFAVYLAGQLRRITLGDGRPCAGHRHTTLISDVATALVESGFELHDCAGRAGRAATGGVCVIPCDEGVLMSWTQHDRQSVDHVRGYDRYAVVQETMNYAVADVLDQLGFSVEGFGQASAHLVTGTRHDPDTDHADL